MLTIRNRLGNLHEYLPTVGHDITKFNQYVEHQVLALRARGEHTTDLIVNLFKAYKVSSDRTFAEYLKKKEDDWMEGHTMQPAALMSLAKNKYHLLVQMKQWNAPTKDKAKILALQSKLAKVEQATKKTQEDQEPKHRLLHARRGCSKLHLSYAWGAWSVTTTIELLAARF